MMAIASETADLDRSSRRARSVRVMPRGTAKYPAAIACVSSWCCETVSSGQMAPQRASADRDDLEPRVHFAGMVEHRAELRAAGHDLPTDHPVLDAERKLDRDAELAVQVDDGRVPVGDPVEAPVGHFGEAVDLQDIRKPGELAGPDPGRLSPDPMVGDRDVLAHVGAIQHLEREVRMSPRERPGPELRRNLDAQRREEDSVRFGVLLRVLEYLEPSPVSGSGSTRARPSASLSMGERFPRLT